MNVQSVFDFVAQLLTPISEPKKDETSHLDQFGKRVKNRRKGGSKGRHFTVARLEAAKIHRTDYAQPPAGDHPALGCGCVLHQANNGRHRLDACALHSHQNDPSPFFDEPEYWRGQRAWAEKERRRYYQLPMESPSERQSLRAFSVSLPWERAWGNPRRMLQGTFNLDNSQGETCGCFFEIRILDVPRKSEDRRTGHFFYAVRIAPCGRSYCVWDHLPVNPKLGHNPWRKNRS